MPYELQDISRRLIERVGNACIYTTSTDRTYFSSFKTVSIWVN